MLAAVIAAVASGASAGAAFQPVVRDPAFATATDGSVTVHPDGVGAARVDELIALADGSVLVHLFTWPNPSWPFPANWVVKLRPDGSLDESFAGTGATPGSARVAPEGYGDMAVDSQGRIVVAAGSRVAWLLPDGTPDPSIAFCTHDCIVNGEPPPVLPVGTSAAASTITSVAIVADDAVVIASRTPDFTMVPVTLSKLDATGEPVAGFGSAPFDRAETEEVGGGLVMARPDGGLLLFLTTGPPRILAFTSDGDPDLGVGNGTGEIALPVVDPATRTVAVAPYPGNRYLMTTTGGAASTLYLLSRDGVPDPNFGEGGHVDLSRLGASAFGALVAQPDGRVMLTADQPDGTQAVTRLTATGLLDASFGAAATPGWLPLGPIDQRWQSQRVDAFALDGDRLLIGSTLAGAPLPTTATGVERYDLPRTEPLPYQLFRLADGPPRPTGIDLPVDVRQPAVRVRNASPD